MKLYIFGSCSGTEPVEGRHHTAFAFELNDRIYWFDAGENCSYTAHLMGVDLLRVSDIFISHTHMDHVGGLGNLLWNIRKISNRTNKLPMYGDVKVYIPNEITFKGILTILENTEGNYKTKYNTLSEKITDGIILKNDDIEVIAVHNMHMPKYENEWSSFSFVIKAEGKKVVYSGDIKEFEELSFVLEDGCDLLLMETGHHTAKDICLKIKEAGYQINEIYFLHHGRDILNDYDKELSKASEINTSVKFCNDKDVFNI